MLSALLWSAALARVLVLSAPPGPGPDAQPAEPPGFADALRIQLARIAEVEKGEPLVGDSLSERVEWAAALVDRADAALAVWVERGRDRGDGKIDFALYVVGRRRGRLLVEVFRLPARQGPDLARTLALKVGEVLDTVLPSSAEPETLATWVGRERAEPPRRVAPVAETTTRGIFELAARGAAGPGSPGAQLAGSFAAGLRWQSARADADVYARVGVDGGLDQIDQAGRIETWELVPGAGVRVVAPTSWGLGLGLQFEGGARRISADGVTPTGRQGTASTWVAYLSTAAVVRHRMGRELELSGALGIEYAPSRVTLTVNEQPVLDLGRIRPIAQVMLVFSYP